MPKNTKLIRTKLVHETLTCKPLDNLSDIQTFLDNPPPWRALCKELIPHSKFVLRNIEHKIACQPELELPETYCHFDPDTEVSTRHDVTKKKLPKTLVCHDMANGYHDDSHIEGTQAYDAYTFYNWAGIDIFCYFSHHFITIPPVSWISVGHAHGVKVIGTIITEWAEGAQLWDRILSSVSEYRNFASAVVAIAKTMKFDGWLLNIENKIAHPEKLLEFVRYLHKTLHEELVDPVLIWYDSVTVTGHLNWQNGLNAKNRAFFDICDGFFTNYSWSIKDVENSAVEAGDRITDLFIGIDVWGRNFYGGGQFNVQMAVKVAHDEGCSLAIFAPAWTREEMSDVPETNLAYPDYFTTFDKFTLRDRALWDSLWPFLNTRLPCQLPFHTSFCRGLGRKRWMYGEVISPGPWYNLRHQQYQPNCAHGPHGYVLSSIQTLMKMSCIMKEHKGIIKYRTDFENFRASSFILTPDVIENEHGNEHDFNDDESVDGVRFLQKRESVLKLQDKPEDELEKEPKTVTHRDIGTATSVEPNVKPAAPRVKKTLKKLIIEKVRTIFKKPETKSLSENNSSPEPCSSARVAIQTDASTVVKSRSSVERGAAVSTALTVSTSQQSAQSKEPNVMDQNAMKGVPDTAQEPESQPSAVDVTGKSMVTMSINLDLHSDPTKLRWALAYLSTERECLALYLEDAFCGGSCLKVNPSDTINPEHRTTKLFECDFQCQDTLVICVVTKELVQSSDQYLNVKLAMVNESGKDLKVVLMGRSLGMQAAITRDSVGIAFSYPINSESQELFRELREYLLLHEPGFYVPIENLYGWDVRYYEVQVPGSRVLQVNCRTGLPQGGILLGHLGICHRVTSKRTASTS